LHLLGILREVQFSPFQHAENDRQILELTARALQRRGCHVDLISESEVPQIEIGAATVFSMCQGSAATAHLAEAERGGTLIINSPLAVQSCYRTRLVRAARPAGSIFAPATIVRTSRVGSPPLPVDDGGLWVKRGDVHATQHGDVVRVRSAGEYAATLADFARRGIREAAVQSHVEGEVVKFYGVVGTSFFRFYTEGDSSVYPVAFGASRSAIEAVVTRLGLEVYGGDAVITPNGQTVVIDINDWPSFACYRREAAEVIGSYIYGRAWQRTQVDGVARSRRAR
jgi:hypothetical protein